MVHKPQSILMTADTVGGVWTYALELARALQPHGVEVQLALMGPPLRPAQHAEAEKIPNLSLFKSDYKLEWMDDCWSDVRRAGDWLLHLATRLRPDVIHLNGYTHADLPWPSPTLVVAHSCVFSWWEAVRRETPPAEWQHFILSAGRLWDEAKNIACLAELAAELPWPVFVAGESQAPQQRNQQEPTSDRCHLLGPLAEAELRDWFGAAAIYALPAVYEPFGYTPLEAGLSACALVLGDIDSLRENWEGAAVFVDPHDSQTLKKELGQLIENR